MSPELIVVIFFAVAILFCLISSGINHIKFQEWAAKKLLKKAFRQGSHYERRQFLKSLVEAIRKEYNEDNWFTSCYWLVEEILISDDNFNQNLFSNEGMGVYIKKGLADAVDEAKKQKGIR